MNHTGGLDTRANLALVPVGADGTVELYLYQVANVVVDVGGWITSSTDAAGESGRLQLSVPTRIADSRNGLGVRAVGAQRSGHPRTDRRAGRCDRTRPERDDGQPCARVDLRDPEPVGRWRRQHPERP